MNISVAGLVFGLLLILIPVYAICYFRLNMMRRLLVSFGYMVVVVAIMAAVIWGALTFESLAYDVAVLLLCPLFSALVALRKARVRASGLLLPVGVGSIVGVAFVFFYAMLLLWGNANPSEHHLMVPLIAILSISITGFNAKALSTYYSGLLHHGQLYNYLIGNGATHREAVSYFVRRCLETAIAASCKQMSRVFLFSAPVFMLTMVMCGVGLFTAVVFQILFYLMVLSASLISLLISLYVGRRYGFDEYNRLKSVFAYKVEETNDVSEDEVSESLSSLSEHDRVGSVSQQ